MKALPHNHEAESALVGGLFLDPRRVGEVAALVKPAEIYDPCLGAVYSAMVELEATGRPVDPVTVAARMEAAGTIGKLAAHGGAVWFASLMGDVVTVENLARYAADIAECAAQRRAVEALEEAKLAAMAGGEDWRDRVGASTLAIVQPNEASGPVPVKRALREVVDAVSRRHERAGQPIGIPTGFDAIDFYTCGLQAGELTIIAARPSMGKTALGMNVAANVAIQGKVPVLVFSLEMSRASLVERMVCSEGRIDAQRVRQGTLQPSDWAGFHKAAGRIHDAPIQIDDGGAPTMAEIRAKARRWRMTEAPDREDGSPAGMVLIDYLQLISPVQVKGKSREQEVCEISRGLKALAKELRCPIVCLCQLSRACESRADKRPQLSDLRESGAIEQDGDVIAFIYREAVYNPKAGGNDAEIIIGKQRNGPTGTAHLAWVDRYTRFEPSSSREDPSARQPPPDYHDPREDA